MTFIKTISADPITESALIYIERGKKMKTRFKNFNKEKQKSKHFSFFNKTKSKSKSFSKQNNNQKQNYKTFNSFLFFFFNFHKIKLLFILFKTKILFYQNSKQKIFKTFSKSKFYFGQLFCFALYPIFSSLARENFYISGAIQIHALYPLPYPTLLC